MANQFDERGGNVQVSGARLTRFEDTSVDQEAYLPSLDSSLSGLSSRLADVDMTLKALTERLEPVLRPDESRPIMAEDKVRTTGSPHRERVLNLVEQVNAQHRWLAALIDRLDV